MEKCSHTFFLACLCSIFAYIKTHKQCTIHTKNFHPEILFVPLLTIPHQIDLWQELFHLFLWYSVNIQFLPKNQASLVGNVVDMLTTCLRQAQMLENSKNDLSVVNMDFFLMSKSCAGGLLWSLIMNKASTHKKCTKKYLLRSKIIPLSEVKMR